MRHTDERSDFVYASDARRSAHQPRPASVALGESSTLPRAPRLEGAGSQLSLRRQSPKPPLSQYQLASLGSQVNALPPLSSSRLAAPCRRL